MITIKVYGLDQFTIGHYSKDHFENLKQLFETKEDILFLASDDYVFYNGVDQNSWQAIVIVDAPEKYEVLEEKVAKYLMETLKDFAINIKVNFRYFHSHHEYEHLNESYPRFIKEDNLVNVEEADDEDELYEGNIFEGMEKKLEEVYKENPHCDCDCGDECDCDDECECEEGECHCGHHKH